MIFSLLISLGAGVVLWWSQPPRRAHWLHFLALTALLVAVSPSGLSATWAAALGLTFAWGYVGPQLLELRLHAALSGLLAISQSLIWMLFALGAWRFARMEATRGALSIAALGALLMWLEWTLLPLWGTAQNFARGWSRAPRLTQFVAFTGVSGAVWVLCFASALAARVMRSPQSWPVVLFDWALAAAVVTALNEWLWRQNRAAGELRGGEIGGTLRVAALGWADIDLSANALSLKLAQAARDAAARGARLLVTPEAAFQVENRAAFRDSLRKLAAQQHLALAVGYFDVARQENCLDFVDAEGEVQGRYVKTHLVPLFENYTRGRGEISCCQIEGVSVGGLICQDDNFSDLAARYGRRNTQLLVIPTHDWRAVKNFHFVNSLWRSLEFRCGMVKATSGGISAIVSPRGEILASCDHFQSGLQLIVADLPVPAAKATLYARCRDWFPPACAVWLLWTYFSK